MQTAPTTTTTTTTTSEPNAPTGANDPRQHARTSRAISRSSFAVVSTVSEAGFPHAAGIVYAAVGTTLYVHTYRSSRKARNIAANDRVAVVIPVRRLPIGPPFTIQFQARATLLEVDDPEIRDHLAAGRFKAIAAHGAFDEPGGCTVRITPTGRIHTFGLGVSPVALARDPLHTGGRSIERL